MQDFARFSREKAIDVLMERLQFELAGVKLYDRVCAVIDAADDPAITRIGDQMREHRDQEIEHALWLEARIRELGGDPTKPTERSVLVSRENKGIEEVVMQDPSLPHLLHALLAAELVDNAGWDLLVELADEAGDRALRKEFHKRLHEEEEHLVFVRRCVEKLAMLDVLGVKERLPATDLGATLG